MFVPRAVTLTSAFLALAGIGVLLTAKATLVAVFGPLGWLGAVWQGNPDRPMHEQLPALGTLTDFGPPAIYMFLLTFAVISHGYAVQKVHGAARISMVTGGLALYVFVLAVPLPYVITRTLLRLLL